MTDARPQVGAEIEGVAGPWDSDGFSRVPLEGGWELRAKGLIPGERARLRIEHRSRGAKVTWGRGEPLPPPSPERRRPPCGIHESCGGCGIQHALDGAQLRLKVQSALELAGLPDDLRAALEEEGRWIRAPRPFGYRNKAVLLPVVRKGRLVLGAFSRGTHHVVDLAGCPVLSPPLEAAAATLRDLLEPVVLRGRRTLRPPGTRRSEGAGAALRALILRGNRAGELLLTFVVDDAEAQDWLWPAVRRLLPAPDGGGDTEDERKGERVASRGGLRGIFLSVQAGEGDAVAGGEPPTLLRGVQHLDENVGGLSLRLLPLGFFQVHVEALEALAERVAQASRGASRILDLYCGGGVLGMLAARAAGPAGAELAGIDASLPGIEAARLDAARNGVAAEFRAGTPATCLRADDGDADLAILDPPRSGARAEDLKALLDLAPRRILYVSCHAASLARDARIVGAAGYRAIRLSPADMLPQTPHVEWLAEFERGS